MVNITPLDLNTTCPEFRFRGPKMVHVKGTFIGKCTGHYKTSTSHDDRLNTNSPGLLSWNTSLQELNCYFWAAVETNMICLYFVVGKYKLEVINGCREAVKSNSTALLLKIIKTGSAWELRIQNRIRVRAQNPKPDLRESSEFKTGSAWELRIQTLNHAVIFF